MLKITRFKIIFFLILLLSFLLRFYKIDSLYHLYDDEVSIGVNAYSVLKTGYDEHGNFLPLWFKAFGEYKLPAYIYLTSLSEFLLGKTELAVRLPSVLAGMFSVGLFVLILKKLNQSDSFSLLAGFLLSISPWHLQFSRGAFEANLALFFLLLAIYLFLKPQCKGETFTLGRCNLLLSFFFFILTLYTYNAYKIFTPLFVISLVIIFRNEFKKLLQLCHPELVLRYTQNSEHVEWISGSRKILSHLQNDNVRGILTIISIGLLLALPIIKFSLSKEGLVRATSESFTQEVKIKPEHFFQNLPFLRFERFLKNYASYFSLDFLFLTGDQNGRHSVREIGENYLWQLPFFLYGLYIAFKRKNRADKVFFSFLILAPLAGSFSRPSPHALRSLTVVVPMIYLTSVGFYESYIRFHLGQGETFAVTLTIAFFLLQYLHIYYVHYPKRTSPDWTGGYKETAEFLSSIERKYEKILLTEKFQNGYVYLLFYGNFKPFCNVILSETKDPAGFFLRLWRTQNDVGCYVKPKESFGQYETVTSPYTKDLEEKMLYVAPPWEKRPEKIVKTIYDSSRNEVFTIWEK